MHLRGHTTKTIIRAMKITTFILLAAILHVSAAGYSQTVTLSEKNASLEKVFRAIYWQTGYQFVYNDETLKGAKPVTIEVNKASIQEVLALCFNDQPLDFVIE